MLPRCINHTHPQSDYTGCLNVELSAGWTVNTRIYEAGICEVHYIKPEELMLSASMKLQL